MWTKLLRMVFNGGLGLDVVKVRVLLSRFQLLMALDCSLLSSSSAEHSKIGEE
jgi:hypothetical protein